MSPGEAAGAFRILTKDPSGGARTGELRTGRGVIRTPAFMAVGTQATVKTLTVEEIRAAGAQVVLCNTYHLYLRPGEDVIRAAGGLHRFMGWDGPILTDSGGFQIFSLATLNKVRPEGVQFQSHVDGSRHFLTPEDVVRVQRTLGSDILMPLDECLKYPSGEAETETSVDLTAQWARRSKEAWLASPEDAERGRGLLFGIVQGGFYPRLRKRSAAQLVELDLPGYAIGGVSVGEPTDRMYEIVEATAPELPEHKPRYLMGVGLPGDLFEAVSRGVDLFDCVVPTRNGRNATVFVPDGKLLLRGASHTRDFRPIDENCPCYACRHHTRAYLRHLFNTEEFLAGRLASLHNLTFLIQLLDSMRRAIEEGRFASFRKDFERRFNRPTTA